MICPRCWKSLPSDAAVCPSCGLTIAPATDSAASQRCPVCGAITAPNALYCPHCGTSLAEPEHPVPASYEPPSPDQQVSSPTTPYAKSQYVQPPIMHTVPLISPIPAPPAASPQATETAPHSLPADPPPTIPVLTRRASSAPAVPILSPAETPAAETSAADEETNWAAVPPLVTTAEPEEIPFAMMPAPVASAAPTEGTETPATSEPVLPEEPEETEQPEEPVEPPAEPEEDGLPDYETPDIERPAIHVPKPPLQDYDTPDEEHTAIHAPPPVWPGYDTPDEERPLVRPSPVSAPTARQLTPMEVASDEEAAHGSANGMGLLPNAVASYPSAYAGPNAAHLEHESAPEAPSPPPPTSDDPIERIFGVQPAPAQRTANNGIQRLWARYLPPEWAVSPWISIPVGAVLALAAALFATAIGLLFWSHAIGYLLDNSTAGGASENLAQALLSPNLLQLYLLAHGVPMSLTLGSPGTSGGFSALETLPLTGLSLLPACALTLGGYLAAASDFTHRLRYSVVRGALIGPVYAILLLLVAVFGSSTVKLAQNTAIQLSPSIGVALLAGLIWGTLLGALGGLLAVRRHHLFTTHRQPDLLAGASWGALIALGSGLLLAVVALAAGMAAHVIGTVPSATVGQASDGLAGFLSAIIVAISLLLVLTPVASLWLFALGTGATIDSWFGASGVATGSGNATFGLLAAQHHPSSIAWWLLLLIPLAGYIIGGRAAAHIARAESLRDGALAGWLMAVVLSLIMLVLTLLSRVLVTSQASVSGHIASTSLGIAPSVGAVFLLVLIVGSIVGTIGGLSAVVAPQLGAMLFPVARPLLLQVAPVLELASRPWDMLDATRTQRMPRTTVRVLIYAAALLAVVLLALFVLVALIGLIISHFAPISAVRGLDGFFAGLLVGVPLLVLASTAILVVLHTLPPLLTRRQTPVPDLPRYPRP